MKIRIKSTRPLSKAELRRIAAKMQKKPVRKAVAGYKRFHWGNDPSRTAKVRIPDPKNGMYELGRLRSVEYETDKGGEVAVWVHRFSKPYPILTAIGKKLGPIVGGRATVTARGIEK